MFDVFLHGKRLVTLRIITVTALMITIMNPIRRWDAQDETAMVDRHFSPFSTQTSLNHHLATVMSVTKVIAHPVQEPKGKMNNLSAGALAVTCRLSSCYAYSLHASKVSSIGESKKGLFNYIRPPFLTFLHLTRQ